MKTITISPFTLKYTRNLGVRSSLQESHRRKPTQVPYIHPPPNTFVIYGLEVDYLTAEVQEYFRDITDIKVRRVVTIKNPARSLFLVMTDFSATDSRFDIDSGQKQRPLGSQK